jgi:hypothetical protein
MVKSEQAQTLVVYIHAPREAKNAEAEIQPIRSVFGQ